MTADALRRVLRTGLDAGRPVRLDLGGLGTVFVDHAVPILAVHRCPGGATGDPALDARAACDQAHQLVTTQPAYVLTSDPDPDAARRQVLRRRVLQARRRLVPQSIAISESVVILICVADSIHEFRVSLYRS